MEELPDEEADRLLPDAVRVIQEYDRASASLLQRRLKIGYARAARIVDQLEATGLRRAVRRVERTTGAPPRGGPAAAPGRWSDGDDNDG